MKNLLFFLMLILALSLGVFSACKKDLDIDPTGNNNNNNPTSDTTIFIIEGIKVSNGNVTKKGFTDVTIKGTFSAFTTNTFTVTNYGHVVSKSTSKPDIDNNNGKSTLGDRNSGELGDFTSVINGLEPGTTYYARVYLEKTDKNTGAVTHGYHPYSFAFSTLASDVPVVIDTIINISSNAFLIEGKIADFKGAAITNHGFVWSSTHSSETALTLLQNEGIKELGEVDITEFHLFNHIVAGLDSDKTYFARAFAQNQYGVGYGKVLQATTLAAPTPMVVVDTIFLVADANNSGQPNPGELVTYNVVLKNVGEVAAQNVDANFFGNDVMMITPQPLDYGSIASNATKSRQVQLQISNAVSEGDMVQVTTEINGDNLQGTTDNSTFVFNIAASPTPKIEIASVILVADANNTGQPNPGELVTYNVVLKNVGEATAQNVDANFFGNDVILITPQPLDYGSIASNATKSKQVQLQISNAVSEGDMVQVTTEINGDNLQGTTDNSTFFFNIAASPAPKIEIATVVITEPNGTGNVNPGEEVTLTITLKNVGDAAANGLNLSIGTSPHYDILSTLPIDYGTIAPNGQKTKEVVIKIGSAVPWNTAVTVPISVTDDSGSNWPFSSGASFTVISPYVVSSGLLIYYNFESTSEFNIGQIKDVLGLNNGVVNGNVSLVADSPSNSGNSLNFPGENESNIKIPNEFDGNSPEFSISFWLKTFDSDACIFDGRWDYHTTPVGYIKGVYLIGTKIFSYNNYTNYHVNTILLNNLWHHVVVTKNSQGKQIIYIDGAFFDEINYGIYSSQGHDASHGYPAYLGVDVKQNSPFYERPYNGKLDNFRVYNRVISLNEVQQIFNAKQ